MGWAISQILRPIIGIILGSVNTSFHQFSTGTDWGNGGGVVINLTLILLSELYIYICVLSVTGGVTI